MAALRYGIIIFHKNEPPLPEVLTPGFRFFCAGRFQLYSNFIPTSLQLYSNYSEKPNCSKLLWNRAIISSLMYQGLDYQIIDVIQLNRAKFIFNRTKKKKPNTCEDVRPFPTSRYYIDDLFR